MDGQLFAGHPDVEQGDSTGLAIAPQPERVLRWVFDSFPQRDEPVKTIGALLRVVEFDMETREEILLRLYRLGHIHRG